MRGRLEYALKVITVVAAVMLPVVLIYQSWSYHVFRRRVSTAQFQSPASPRIIETGG